MAELVVSSAKGAVKSLLGRISTMLVNEAQLLGRVRRDMQFIKDEMEMMDAFLLLLLHQQAGTLDHHYHSQCTPWIRQAMELARDCQDCVEQYAQCIAAGPPSKSLLLGLLRRVSWLVRSFPERHRLAVQIQDIKVRLGEVSHRRKTYDICANLNSYRPPEQDNGGEQEDEAAWRRYLASAEPPADLWSESAWIQVRLLLRESTSTPLSPACLTARLGSLSVIVNLLFRFSRIYYVNLFSL